MYVCVCVYKYTRRIFFIHSSFSGRLVCFRVLAVVTSASWTLGCMYLSQLEFLCLYAQEWDSWIAWQL